jgi:hypothetical protein
MGFFLNPLSPYNLSGKFTWRFDYGTCRRAQQQQRSIFLEEEHSEGSKSATAVEALDGGSFLEARADEAEPYSGDEAAPPLSDGRTATLQDCISAEGEIGGGSRDLRPRFGAGGGGDQAVVH